MIDLDDFSSSRNYKVAGSPLHLNAKLFQQVFNKTADSKCLQTCDEFAFALTLMEVAGVDIPNETAKYYFSIGMSIRMRVDNIVMTPKMEEYVKKNIKPEYVKQFTMLVTDPYKYSKNKSGIYLVDMFNF